MDACASKCSPRAVAGNGCKAHVAVAQGPAAGAAIDQASEQQQLQNRLRSIRHKILVLSGKGGVGKSTVAANLAVTLALAGRRVGLLDVDIHGPSIPKMLRIEDAGVEVVTEGVLRPVDAAGIKVMSIGFLLRHRDDAVIWRGPMKMGVIKQFLKDVEWGDLDYLVIDSPPGTGDEPLSVCQLVEDADGAVIVTTPQDVATADVRRSISFCRQLGMPVLGVIENMSGFVCPKCGEVTDIFKSGGGQRLATEMHAPFLGRIPIDPAVAEACDAGRPFMYQGAGSATAKAFGRVVAPILALAGCADAAAAGPLPQAGDQPKEQPMRIAVPVANGRLSMHFGHCETFALVDVDPQSKTILKQETLAAPEHEPGLLPRWLAERGAQVIIAGGMGQRAQGLFAENRITVVVGAPAGDPGSLVRAFLDGTLQTGDNVCDH
jgi:ATP-binding protein involved in chromosome partitioning